MGESLVLSLEKWQILTVQDSFTWNVFTLTSGYSTGLANHALHPIVAGNDKRDENQTIAHYLYILSNKFPHSVS